MSSEEININPPVIENDDEVAVNNDNNAQEAGDIRLVNQPVEPNPAEQEHEEEPGERRVQNRINDIFRIFINRLLPVNDENMNEGENEDYQIDEERIDEDEDEDANSDNENYVEGDDDDEDDDDNGDEEVNEEEYNVQSEMPNTNYDLALPTDHRYLGEHFERVNAPKTIHEHNDEVQIPILSFPGNEHAFLRNTNNNNIQLLPGQIMPLFFYSPNQVNLIKKRMKDQDPTIGFALTSNFYKILLEKNGSDLDKYENARFGILAEIIEVETRNESSQFENETNNMMQGFDGLVIKVRGRERFKIIDVRREITGCLIANVKILPDIVVKNPLYITKKKNSKLFLDSYLCKTDRKLLNSNNPIICSNSKAELFTVTQGLPFNAWLYRMNDCDYIINLIIKELTETFRKKITFENPAQHSNKDNEIDYKDPLFFSNWLLNNFPFSDQMRINVLVSNSVNQRLIYMLSLLKNFTKIICITCNNQLCSSTDVFSLSNTGFMTSFLNPGGVIHETLTVYKLKNFRLSKSPPSTEHSWFPGYGWQICSCKNCNNHIGWKYSATNKDLQPQYFWGLTRSSIRHSYNQDETQENKQTIIN